MALLEQRLHFEALPDVRPEVRRIVTSCLANPRVRRGDTVAVGVGSRNVSHISDIVREAVAVLKHGGLLPVIVPAMGSHGGSSTQGELSVLAGLGITEHSVGAPIDASQETVEIGTLGSGAPILLARPAADADHIVVINRVKPHTKFAPPLGSGPSKMLAIGLGKQAGAAIYHQAAVRESFSILLEGARRIMETRSVLVGLAVLEDAHGSVAQIHGLDPASDWFDVERTLVQLSLSKMARIPFDEIDVLIVDQMGKDISGIGMDSNVTGRHRDIVGDFFLPPRPRRVFVRDLSPGSHGNAAGVGLADFVTRRLVRAIDMHSTYTNALTAISPEKAAIPMNFETDRECVSACLATIGLENHAKARVVRIKSTSSLERMEISRALESEVGQREGLTLLSSWRSMAFDGDDNLEPLGS